MRVALIADIHGNFVALENVLAAINRNDVDQIICLGDVAAKRIEHQNFNMDKGEKV